MAYLRSFLRSLENISYCLRRSLPAMSRIESLAWALPSATWMQKTVQVRTRADVIIKLEGLWTRPLPSRSCLLAESLYLDPVEQRYCILNLRRKLLWVSGQEETSVQLSLSREPRISDLLAAVAIPHRPLVRHKKRSPRLGRTLSVKKHALLDSLVDRRRVPARQL